MDDSFDCLALDHKNQDKVRYLKQMLFGEKRDDTPDVMIPPNGLKHVSYRELERLGFPRNRCVILLLNCLHSFI